MYAKFEVALKTPLVINNTIVRKFDGAEMMEDVAMLASAAAVWDSISVHETDMKPEELEVALTDLMKQPVFFIGFYAKEKDRFGKSHNVSTEKLVENGWMFFAKHRKASKRELGTVTFGK